MSNVNVPKYQELIYPTIKALTDLGGSGTVSEIVEQIIRNEGYKDEVLSVLHSDGRMTKVAYNAAWARTYLRTYGAVESRKRGLWALTDLGRNFAKDDVDNVVHTVRQQIMERRKQDSSSETDALPLMTEAVLKAAQADENTASEELDWKQELLNVLYNISPAAFERLCQRLLRESGFIEVEVMGRTGDGGLDGVGILRMNLVSFRVHFQCKRYQGGISNAAIRDFRGATVGRSDRGLFITTGHFTRAAKEEASRDGAALIDLIDGETLCDLLYDLKLGVSVQTIERVVVDRRWYEGI